MAIFSSNGSNDPSIMTELNPQWTARMMLAKLSPWSMWITNGTELFFARDTAYWKNSSLVKSNSVGWTAMIAGASFSSAASMTTRKKLLSATLKAPTANLFSFATSSICFILINIWLCLHSHFKIYFLNPKVRYTVSQLLFQLPSFDEQASDNPPQDFLLIAFGLRLFAPS